MTTDYTQIDTELLVQMVRVAKQNPATPQEQLGALQQAVEERKQQLLAHRAELANQPCHTDEAIRHNTEAELAIYRQLITLEPDNHQYYRQAGQSALFLPDYPAAAAYYTAALQLVGDDIDTLAELYKERSRTYCRYKDYANALADSKLYLRFKYQSEKGKNYRYYNLYMLYESLKQLGHKALGDAIDTTYELADLSYIGVTDELIEDYLHLLEIPFAPQRTRTRPPLARFHELLQQLPTEPQEVKKWQLRKQFYEENEKANPDDALLIKLMQELLRFEPTYYRYHATIGGLYFKQKNYKAAIAHLTKALALVDQFPGNSRWRQTTRKEDLYALHRMLAYMAVFERSYWTAINHYEQAIRAYPEFDHAYRLLALMIQIMIYIGDGERASAMGEYYRKSFPDGLDRKYIVPLEQDWADCLARFTFVEFAKVGVELGRNEQYRDRAGELENQTSAREKTEEEKRQEQKAAETLKHLEQMVRLSRAS